MRKIALLYEKLADKKVKCNLCNHHCQILPGKLGICGVRENTDGTLYTNAYGQLISRNIDPIEKKPIFHMLPGSLSYSFSTIGCNFRCGFCQNWEISQFPEAKKLGLKTIAMTPEEIVKETQYSNCPSISYTYTEPTVFFEYAYETMQLAKKAGLYNIFVTNGFMSPECLEMTKGCLDAANVDLKSFSDQFYRKICGARLEPVLESIRLMRKLGIWVEITTLVIPGENDSTDELTGIAEFIASVDKSIPWHISQFHADYKMQDKESTPLEKLNQAYKIGKDKGLRYVYIGNITAQVNTFCYNCNALLIRRLGFSVLENNIKSSKCPQCKVIIEGVKIDGK